MINAPQYIKGTTFHGRKGDTQNAFRYTVDYVLVDAERDVRHPWFFGRNKGGFCALHDKDHGGVPGQGRGAAWVRDVLGQVPFRVETIELLAQPRILGHVFNPVSFWLIRDEDNALRTVIAEVTNTYGDRHSYLCHREDFGPITKTDTLNSQKIFYVSPFQPVEGGYQFRFDINEDRLGIWIDYSAGNGGLLATLTGKRRTLTSLHILAMMVCRPFGSRRVLGLIHWQALKLWWKGVRFRTRPEPPRQEVSR